MTEAKTVLDRLAFAGFGLMVTAAMAIAPAAQAEKPNPYLMLNNTWITINGSVESVTVDSFELDYGDGMVTVEMDDGDRDADAYKLVKGDKVIVSGLVDDDFYEATTIEASSVFVENLGTTFFASAVDEEDFDSWNIAVTAPAVVSETVVYGTVTKVEGDEFMVDSGLRELRVETEELGYNPLDDEGYQKISVGDRVKVTGTIDDDFFEGRELVAKTLIELSQ